LDGINLEAGRVLTLITLGTFILGALSILCFAAYKIKAKEFEFSTAIWRLASFKITIKSPQDSELSKQMGEFERPQVLGAPEPGPQFAEY
jgi:hypothetical protein